MKHLMWALLLSALYAQTSASADGFTLDNAPWSDETFEVCETPMLNGLRPVIFEPKFELGEASTPYQTTRLSYNFNAETGKPILTEIIIPGQARFVFLKEQYVGFLNGSNQWVDKNGAPVSNKSQFVKHIGDMKQGTKEIFPEITDLPGNDAYEKFDNAIEKAKKELQEMPDCTTHYAGAYDIVEETVVRKYGPNNPMICDRVEGYKISDVLDHTIKADRQVVSMPDGGAHLIQLPGGEIKEYGSIYFDHLLEQISNHPNCDWKSYEDRLAEQQQSSDK